MLKYAAIFMLFMSLTGCGPNGHWEIDQKLRAKLFQQCLSLVPKGPQTTVYNDWAEVVDECEDAAYFQSKYWVEDN